MNKDKIEAWLKDQEDWFYEPDGVDKEVAQLLALVRVYREVANICPEQDRRLGYPTGPEWIELVKQARSAEEKAMEIVAGVPAPGEGK